MNDPLELDVKTRTKKVKYKDKEYTYPHQYIDIPSTTKIGKRAVVMDIEFYNYLVTGQIHLSDKGLEDYSRAVARISDVIKKKEDKLKKAKKTKETGHNPKNEIEEERHEEDDGDEIPTPHTI